MEEKSAGGIINNCLDLDFVDWRECIVPAFFDFAPPSDLFTYSPP